MFYGFILLTIGVILLFISNWLWKKGDPNETFKEALGELVSDLIGWQLPLVFSGIKAWSLFICFIGLVSILLGVLFVIF
ncbi:hypothetical protein [Pseudalkalibacillus salsuginis]|uniref:hypothetical protein n=1 Tax=Pseudalkalibacillus salsuginis TaxID=2910972 RepID=UPI001CD7DF9F|nr:hypothetical protein [Pseudalkalibacillus salsuginis]MCF6410692.1 hypothetical protein [Pseudalkalibacillus salsuginis]